MHQVHRISWFKMSTTVIGENVVIHLDDVEYQDADVLGNEFQDSTCKLKITHTVWGLWFYKKKHPSTIDHDGEM